MKVLIVEDEIRIREGIRKLLTKLSEEYLVIGEAENGLQGLNMVMDLRPDLVITDIKMPQMDGLEMLLQLSAKDIHVKAIVLSAYSEFEYARQAVKLGVTEYLLKPISYNDFAQAMEHVKEQIKAERSKKPDQIGTIEQIFMGLIGGHMEINDEIIKYLSENYNISSSQSFVLLCAFLGEEYDNSSQKIVSYLRHVFSLYKNLSFCLIESSYRDSLIIVLYNYDNVHELERWVQYQLLNNNEYNLALGWVEVSGVERIQEGINNLYPYMDWNISFNQDVLISYPKIKQVKTDSCIYPIELESGMKAAVCTNNREKIESIMSSFHKNFSDGRIYIPKEIKECYVRFLWMIIGIAKEVNSLSAKELDQQKLLGKIMGAHVKKELYAASDFLIDNICSKKDDDAITHLTVKKAKSLIHEFYRTGITLEEIGMKLSITPEYLGTLFHKEVGVSFSAYIRNYRIEKAKELLCGTQLKLYEIAEQVGYSDSKYFGKVFKEATGMLPTEYRKNFQ